MDQEKLIHTLGLIPDGIFIITDARITQWGRDVIFDCDYQTSQPDGTLDAPVSFKLVFRDCRDLKWRSYAHIALSEFGEIALKTEVVEIALGQSNHRRDANLITTHFAATLTYGDVVLEHETERYLVET